MINKEAAHQLGMTLGMKKSSYYGDYKQPVDINMAKIQVMADPFMTNRDKLKMTGLFDATAMSGPSNHTTNATGLTGTLLRTGANALTANFAGKMIGSLFSLPTETTNVLRGSGVLFSTLKGLNII